MDKDKILEVVKRHLDMMTNDSLGYYNKQYQQGYIDALKMVIQLFNPKLFK